MMTVIENEITNMVNYPMTILFSLMKALMSSFWRSSVFTTRISLMSWIAYIIVMKRRAAMFSHYSNMKFENLIQSKTTHTTWLKIQMVVTEH